MLILKHRINSIPQLHSVPRKYGVELDLHFYDGDIRVGHDPNGLETCFETYLSEYQHAFMAVNIKEEGIEDMVLDSLRRHQIVDFFLFDLTFPSIFRLMSSGESRIAVRISDFESVRDLNFIRNRVEWLWIDIFESAEFLDKLDWQEFVGFKKCLASPELHLNRKIEISNNLRDVVLPYMDELDAVCTKDESLWRSS